MLLYAAYGFWSMPNFGSPTDEFTQLAIGMENARFIAGNSEIKKIADHQFFGPIIETPLYLLEQLVYTQDISVKLYLRHSAIFLLFLLGLWVFFKLIKRLTAHEPAAFLGTAALACNPRLFAHAHYNTKDTAFLCFVIFALYLFVKFLQTKEIKPLLFAAIWIGLATSIRLAGAFIGLACLSTLVLAIKNNSKIYFYFVGLSIFSFILAFPYLWVHPFEGILDLLGYTSKNPYPWDVLFAGQMLSKGEGLWYYVPLSLGITISIPVLILFLIYLIRSVKSILKNRFTHEQILLFQVFTLPILYFIFTSPVFYNMGRHTQFMLIPIYIGAATVIAAIWKNAMAKWASVGFLALSFLALPAYQGNEMVYFNGIKSLWKPYSFEMDYWTISTKNALDDLLEDNEEVKVYTFDAASQNSLNMMPAKDRKRISFTSKDSADYELDFFRDVPLKPTEKTNKSYGAKQEPYLLVNRLK